MPGWSGIGKRMMVAASSTEGTLSICEPRLDQASTMAGSTTFIAYSLNLSASVMLCSAIKYAVISPSSVNRPPKLAASPEPIFPLLVTLIFTELDCLCVLHSPDVYFRKRSGNAVSFRINSDQSDDEIVVSKHVLHVDAEHPSGKFHCTLKETSDLVMPPVVARKRAMTGNVPRDVWVKYLEHRRDVSVCKVFVGFANDCRIRLAHRSPPLVSFPRLRSSSAYL